MAISSQEIPLTAWRLFLSQRQDFLSNHLARVPVTPNQQGTHERRDEVFSCVGAQNIITSGYQVSDLDDAEFYWANDQPHIDAVFRPDIDAPFSSLTFSDFEMDSMAENPILIDKAEEKENSPPPHPRTPVSERPIQPPVLMRCRPFGARNENVPDYVYRKLFQYFIFLLLCMCFKRNYN